MDTLKRQIETMSTTISTSKGQLAHLKSVQEDMEATCQHALLERQIALKELAVLKSKNAGRAPFSFFRSSNSSSGMDSSSCLSPQPKGVASPL